MDGSVDDRFDEESDPLKEHGKKALFTVGNYGRLWYSFSNCEPKEKKDRPVRSKIANMLHAAQKSNLAMNAKQLKPSIYVFPWSYIESFNIVPTLDSGISITGLDYYEGMIQWEVLRQNLLKPDSSIHCNDS